MNTPYYVIHKKELDDNFHKLQCAIAEHWENAIIGYSYKTNALPWIIKHFDKLGCYAEVVSEDEYELAKLIGVKKDCIIYNGPIKTKPSFAEAIKNGCIVNVDSQRELNWLDELDIEKNPLVSALTLILKNIVRDSLNVAMKVGALAFVWKMESLAKSLID